MQPVHIPMPEALDPERAVHLPAAGEAAAGESLVPRRVLEHVCAYGRQLWTELDAVRSYLVTSLPSDPRLPGPHRLGASPAGPDDEEGWDRWVDLFAAVSSALAGPQGDSGFGLNEARHQARLRRTATNLRALARRPGLEGHPEIALGGASGSGSAPTSSRAGTAASAGIVAVATLLAENGLLWWLRRRRDGSAAD